MVTMKKGQTKRVWAPEQKAEIVYKHLNDHISVRTLEKEYLDFGLAATEDVPSLLDKYVHYFNNRRPAATLGYKSPVPYRTKLGF